VYAQDIAAGRTQGEMQEKPVAACLVEQAAAALQAMQAAK